MTYRKKNDSDFRVLKSHTVISGKFTTAKWKRALYLRLLWAIEIAKERGDEFALFQFQIVERSWDHSRKQKDPCTTADMDGVNVYIEEYGAEEFFWT